MFYIYQEATHAPRDRYISRLYHTQCAHRHTHIHTLTIGPGGPLGPDGPSFPGGPCVETTTHNHTWAKNTKGTLSMQYICVVWSYIGLKFDSVFINDVEKMNDHVGELSGTAKWFWLM